MSSIRDLFEHKYPITNLHEIDLSYVLAEIDEMISILESWEELINEIREGLKTLNSIDDRVRALEALTSNLNKAYADIEALKKDNSKIFDSINKIKSDMDDLIEAWNQMFIAFSNATNAKLQAEKNERVNADYMLNAALYSFKYQVESEFDAIYNILESLISKVYNPGCGYKVDLKTNTRKTYIHLRDKGITIGRLLQRNILVSDIADKYRCVDLACKGLDIFKYTNYIYSPGDGKHKLIHQTFSDIYGKIYSSDTYQNAIAANLTIADIIALDKTYGELLSYQF